MTRRQSQIPTLVLLGGLVVTVAGCGKSSPEMALVLIDVQANGSVPTFSTLLFSVTDRTRLPSRTVPNAPRMIRFGYYLPGVNGSVTVKGQAISADGCVVGEGSVTATGIKVGAATDGGMLLLAALAQPFCDLDAGAEDATADSAPDGSGGSGSGGTGAGGGNGSGGVGAIGSGGAGATATGGTGPGSGGTGGGIGGRTGTGGTVGSGGGTGTGGMGTGGRGTGGASTGGMGTGGRGTGGANTGGANTGGANTGGANTGGANTGGANTGGATGTGGAAVRVDGPCDIYAAANTPCAAAYSMVRALSKSYTGPLYQVRSGSSAMNTGSGGLLKDIPMLPDGFADTAMQDAFCAGTVCTVSQLYDHSGNANHLPVAKKGSTNGGTFAGMDDFESAADKGMMVINGHKVYSLYMNTREGYRIMRVGTQMPTGSAPQGIYMLADGTHSGSACCWDFGNVTTNPMMYADMTALFFGIAFWGKGAGAGPWMMADFEAGVWSGGSMVGDPGWGALDDNQNRVNPANPSLKVPFAFGILRTQTSQWTLRSADLQTATSITTSYQGAMPKPISNIGAIVLGVAGDNSNNSWGTFYEGAIVAGYPTDATDLAIFNNIKAVGYNR